MLPSVLKVKGANFSGANENMRLRVSLAKCPRHSQTVEGTVTAHESYIGALDLTIQLQLIDQMQIDPRGGKTGARDSN
jgi:hypothetical protein